MPPKQVKRKRQLVEEAKKGREARKKLRMNMMSPGGDQGSGGACSSGTSQGVDKAGTSLVPSPSFFARRKARGALRAGKKKEGPGIQRSRMRQFFQFFSEFGYFSGHFSIFTRENVIIIGVAS